MWKEAVVADVRVQTEGDYGYHKAMIIGVSVEIRTGHLQNTNTALAIWFGVK
jgi:hypothetical protein